MLRRLKLLPIISVFKATAAQVPIYFTNYWLPSCPLLPAGIDMDFFDNGVKKNRPAASSCCGARAPRHRGRPHRPHHQTHENEFSMLGSRHKHKKGARRFRSFCHTVF
jgi:hypothetical protein